ncbi:uncharacterized protein LOC132636787 isoform X2 [Lycium barbarum]|uniref:uncharacterized protein LOC132636787 isoform X2 n=1 Tax=Lycium barbarum TaxID=112863 RepID=UPI00293F266B|nr:uncharacterized protein LOC132636787 isoform X2 [Lycium barbarum]
MCRTYNVTLAQIGPIVWRAVACLRLLANNAGKEFTLAHLIRLYPSRLFRGGVIKLAKRSRNPIFSKMDEDRDRGWLERYVRVRTSDIIPGNYMPFPERWNNNPMGWIPPVVRDLNEWVTALLSQHVHDDRSWGHLSRGRWVAQNHGLPKGSVDPRPESAAEPATSAPEFDSAGASRILAAAAKRKRPSDKGQKPKKRARSVTRTLRDETKPELLVRRISAAPSVAPIPEEGITVSPLPSAGEEPSAPALRTGDSSSEETSLQRIRRSGEAPAAPWHLLPGPVKGLSRSPRPKSLRMLVRRPTMRLPQLRRSLPLPKLLKSLRVLQFRPQDRMSLMKCSRTPLLLPAKLLVSDISRSLEPRGRLVGPPSPVPEIAWCAPFRPQVWNRGGRDRL